MNSWRGRGLTARQHTTVLSLLIGAIALVGCGGPYALECDQGVERSNCVRIAAFAFESAQIDAERVHVQARSCGRYLDQPSPDDRCWSVRIESADGRVIVPVANDASEGFFRPTDLFPLGESGPGDSGS